DNTTSQVYPRWSLTAPDPSAKISDVGTLPEFSLSADMVVTVQASFTANGATVTASKVVTVLDNRIESLQVTGPPTVFLNNPSPPKFSATATWRDGAVIPADVTWSVVAGPGTGSISSSGLFSGTAPGSVTVRATNGSLTADATTSVVAGTPSTGSLVFD